VSASVRVLRLSTSTEHKCDQLSNTQNMEFCIHTLSFGTILRLVDGGGRHLVVMLLGYRSS
jgi:hypothetical protein